MAISEYNYIPTYIKRTIANKPKDVVTASYWNELFNLLITQGDHTAKELGNILNHFTAAINEVKGIADGKYVKPTNGIPKTDLAAAVQTSLDKADTALQTHQSLAAYRTAFAQDVIDSDLGDRISAIESKESGWDAKQDKLTAGDNITITENGTISSTGGGAKAFFLNVFVITETQVVTNKTYAEIKAAIDAGDIIYITDKNDVVYMPQVAKTGSKIEFLWLDSHENRTYRWSAVVNSENVWSVTLPELATTDELGNLAALKTQADDNLVVAINEVKHTTDTKQDKLIAGENITIAADGKTISAIGGSSASIVMRVNSGYIQYSTDNGNTWSNLIAEADLKGDKGDTGPKGERGPSGVSPTISLEETASGVMINIVDSDGSTGTAYVLHGQSAYDAARDGGYTGTETEFAKKLAQEQLIGTTDALTPTQVYQAVSAGIPVKVQYLDSNSGIFSYTNFNAAENMKAIAANTIIYYNGVHMLGELIGNTASNEWFFLSTALAQKTDIPSALPNPNALTFTGAVAGTYNGSETMTVNIPSAVTDDHINSLIDTKLGVIENGSY